MAGATMWFLRKTQEEKALLIDAETEECFLLPDGPGGVMTFIQAPGESAMLSIEEILSRL